MLSGEGIVAEKIFLGLKVVKSSELCNHSGDLKKILQVPDLRQVALQASVFCQILTKHGHFRGAS